MNLYKVIFQHYAPKGSHGGIECLVLANNDEQVYEFIANDKYWTSWKDYEKDADGKEWCDEEGKEISSKEYYIANRGEFEDDAHIHFEDSYYGITLYGWKLLKENTNEDYKELIELGIIFKV